MNIVIAGGAGFVGSNLLTAWVKKNPKYSFLILDSVSAEGHELPEAFFSKRVSYQTVDIRNKRVVQEIVAEFNPDCIINAIDASRDPDYLQIHIASAENLLEIAKASKVTQYIHLSCGEVYGSANPAQGAQQAHRLLNEYDALLPGSPQQASKAATDLLTWSYYQRYGVPVTILRSAYLYGPYQSTQRLIPLIISHALKNQPFPIPAGNGDLRDIMHIDDFVSAIELVLGNSESIGQIYNVSGGVRIRVSEIADIILAILDRSKNLMQIDEQSVSKSFIGLDASKIKNELGWKVDSSQDVHSMIENTVNWYKDHKGWWDDERYD